jgi:transposase
VVELEKTEILKIVHMDYGHEPDANVRERILLLRRVRMDKQEAASVAELELHRSRGWAYKWLKRYNNDGMLGLRQTT